MKRTFKHALSTLMALVILLSMTITAFAVVTPPDLWSKDAAAILNTIEGCEGVEAEDLEVIWTEEITISSPCAVMFSIPCSKPGAFYAFEYDENESCWKLMSMGACPNVTSMLHTSGYVTLLHGNTDQYESMDDHAAHTMYQEYCMTPILEGQPATQTEDGWKDIYLCSICGKCFSDANDEIQISYDKYDGRTDLGIDEGPVSASKFNISDDAINAWKTGAGRIPKLPTPYQVTIDDSITNGIVKASVESADENDEVVVTVIPCEGYLLKEGSLKYNDGTSDTEIVYSSDAYRFSMPAAAVTVTAEFVKEPRPLGFRLPTIHILTFHTDGGSKITGVSRAYGTMLALDKYIPTKDGYTFGGWYSDKALTKPIEKLQFTGNRDVYAKWIAVESTEEAAEN